METGQDYIIKVIQHLDYRHSISFFITSKDFDTLYNWWEKRIPVKLIKESISTVVGRWQSKNKSITGFSCFKYEVRKNFKAFMELNIGSGTETKEESSKEDQATNEMALFMAHFPEPLLPIKEDFVALQKCLIEKLPLETEGLYRKLVQLFSQDPQLNIKTDIFLRQLPPERRKPEIRERYRLNFLINKYGIPQLELY